MSKNQEALTETIATLEARIEALEARLERYALIMERVDGQHQIQLVWAFNDLAEIESRLGIERDTPRMEDVLMLGPVEDDLEQGVGKP